MSALGRPDFDRRPDDGAPLFGEAAVARKSASHGEAGYMRRPRDAYFTEPWVTRALLLAEAFDPVVWEPACGDGRMARVLFDAGYDVVASDIFDYGWPGTRLLDFLRCPPPWLWSDETPWLPAAIITNPPFGETAAAFVRRALALTEPACGKVAILQRHDFDAPARNAPLFAPPFAAKLILPRRPRWVDQVATGNEKGARFPFAWYLWDWGWTGLPVIRRLPDERKGRLTLLPPAGFG